MNGAVDPVPMNLLKKDKWRRKGLTRRKPRLGGGGRVHSDDEGTVAGCYLLRVIPFHVGGGTVPEVDGFPEGVITLRKISLGRDTGRNGKYLGRTTVLGY